MDDAAVGATLRAVRIRLSWRQQDVAAKARVSPSLVSLVERGHFDRVAVAMVRRIAAALDVRILLVPRWRGGDLDRLVHAAHEGLREEIARYLVGLRGWVHAPEVSFSVFGERGVIDILAYHPATRSLLVIELKTEVTSIEDLLVTMDRRVRLATGIARDRDWNPLTISAWVLIGESDANRRRVRAHATTLRSAFPAQGREIRSWLRRPQGRISALSFWANSHQGGATRRLAARKRVRRPPTSRNSR